VVTRRSAAHGAVFESPARLVYTWRTQRSRGEPSMAQRICVELHEAGDATQVVLTHEPFTTEREREAYAPAWRGFLDLLAADLV
jgi:uncharacterized protein YndB with AHSA1/START domain